MMKVDCKRYGLIDEEGTFLDDSFLMFRQATQVVKSLSRLKRTQVTCFQILMENSTSPKDLEGRGLPFSPADFSLCLEVF